MQHHIYILFVSRLHVYVYVSKGSISLYSKIIFGKIELHAIELLCFVGLSGITKTTATKTYNKKHTIPQLYFKCIVVAFICKFMSLYVYMVSIYL